MQCVDSVARVSGYRDKMNSAEKVLVPANRNGCLNLTRMYSFVAVVESEYPDVQVLVVVV
jgi:hypothetical protein